MNEQRELNRYEKTKINLNKIDPPILKNEPSAFRFQSHFNLPNQNMTKVVGETSFQSNIPTVDPDKSNIFMSSTFDTGKPNSDRSSRKAGTRNVI